LSDFFNLLMSVGGKTIKNWITRLNILETDRINRIM